MDSETLHFFGFIGGQEGEHRGRFDATGVREGCNDHSLRGLVCAREAKRGLLEGGGYPLEEIRFFCFFNTIRYKIGKENLLK